jgi:hypothetical protein
MPRSKQYVVPCLILAALVTGSATVAQADNKDEEMGTSTANNPVATPGSLANETVGIKPEIGLLNFHDSQGQNATRGAIGIHYDFNMSNLLSSIGGNRVYFGPSVGALYSHLGASGASWFGSSPSVNDGTGGGNLIEFPLDLKLGYNVFDNLRISAHGGGTLLYRSIADSMQIDNSTSGASSWKIFPAVGGDVEFGIAKNVALDLRPDVTLTPVNTLFTGAIGVGIALD